MTGAADGSPAVQGLLLAAGAGRRMGRPKGLMLSPAGEAWVARGVRVLLDGGCGEVMVVLGAAADGVDRLVPRSPQVHTTVAADWADGMGSSLRAGLGALSDSTADQTVVLLVDLPDITAAVVRRVLEAADPGRESLARAAYSGVPGHPVVLGRNHWSGAAGEATGDQGARSYLAQHGVRLVECGDLASGRDVDRPPGGQGTADRNT